MTHPRTQALIDLHTKPAARQNPSHGIAASRAGAAALRPCSPIDQPYAPSRMYACSTRHCGSWVELAPTAPLPDDWITVTIAAERGRAARVGGGAGLTSGAGRSVMTARGLEVVDPVALAAAGVRLAECRGLEWTEWVPL